MEFHLCLGFLVSKSCLNSIMFRKARKTKQQLKRKENAVHFFGSFGFLVKRKENTMHFLESFGLLVSLSPVANII